MSLPEVSFGKHSISRLIVGGNPLRGNSHFSPERNAEMAEYYATENVLKTWFSSEKAGITAMQSRGDQIVMDWVDRYRERGGKMHWIVQTASEWKDGDVADNIWTVAKHHPVAIYHHGTRTDNLCKQGRIEQFRDHLKQIHDEGLLAGVGSHMPEVFEYIEDKGWEADFYMTCAYNLSREERESFLVDGSAKVEVYDDADRDRMTDFVLSTPKQCILFKILAASRKCASQSDVREAFTYAFKRIKPIDVVDVGVFQRDRDEIALDAEYVRQATGWKS